MKIFSSKKRVAVIGALTAVTLVGGGTAFAYFTTTGAGTGTGTVGTSTALTLDQATIAYSNAPTNTLLPGTSATVTFTVDNPSSGQQRLGTVSLASVTSTTNPGCNSTLHPSWFAAAPLPVNLDYTPGNDQPVSGTMTINFVNDVANSQDVCKDATLTFNYTSN